jgi:site-specific DNA-methyltransferase (adenine-specific)
LFRVSKNQIIWGGNYFTEYLPPKMCWLCWDKMQKNFTFSDFELAWTSFDTKCRKFDLIRGFDEKGKHYSADNGRIHPTQKPTALYRWILHNYAKKGMKILDTHLGSGSSRIAADKAGLDFTGIEIDKEYYDLQEKRWNNYKSQLKIF